MRFLATPAAFRSLSSWALAAALFAASPAIVAVTADSIVLTLGGENGGQGVNALQCNNGVATATINLQASVNVNNIHAYQPMAETGLPTVTATIMLNGAPAQLVQNNAFNVQSSMVTGNKWIFQLQDDGPHPGGQFNLGPCTAGTTPTVTLSFTSSAITDATGLPNGADGGPAVPAVNGPVTVVNALPAQFNGGSAAGAVAATTSTAPATTSAPTGGNTGGVTTVTVTSTVTQTITVTAGGGGGGTATTTTAAAATTTTAAAANAQAGACTVTIPANALSAAGLASVWIVSGNGCTQTADGMPTFAECTIFDPATNNVMVYSPLLANKGQKTITPTAITLPANAVVGCWFGTNGMTTTLADNNNGKDLTAAGCVNGGGATGIFGQFATCNGAAFFNAANKANINIPALGTGKNGKPCYTTRSFELVDMDQSDNVITTYLTDAAGTTIGQKTTANAKTLQTELNNGSDNLLLDLFMRPAFGCTAFTATNLADPNGAPVGSLALNELQANKLQANPIATVPPNDPMVVDGNGNFAPAKQNLYRNAVGQGNGQGNKAEAAAYCQNYLDVNIPALITDSKFTIGFSTPDAANGKDLYTFLGQRVEASWVGLGCMDLVTVTYLNAKVTNPVIANRDGNGVTQSITYNTAALVALAQKNGLATATTTTATTTANAGGNKGGVATATTTATAGGTSVTHTVNSGFSNSGWCSGDGKFTTQLNLNVNKVTPSMTGTACAGNLPMAECGLPTIKVSVLKNGAAVNVVSFSGGNKDATGNSFTFTEADDAPYFGGALTLDIPCSYTDAANSPATAAAGITFTVTPVTTQVDLTLSNQSTVKATVLAVLA